MAHILLSHPTKSARMCEKSYLQLKWEHFKAASAPVCGLA